MAAISFRGAQAESNVFALPAAQFRAPLQALGAIADHIALQSLIVYAEQTSEGEG